MISCDTPRPGEEVRTSDSALLEGLRQRTPEACVALYDRFAEGIFRFAALRLPEDTQTAEEVVVQTFADAVRDIGRFNPKQSNLSAWLFGIARRRIQAEIRIRKRLKSVPLAAQIPLEQVAEAASQGDFATGVTERLVAKQKVAVLTEVLTETEMEALTLQSVEELSAREIGRIMGRSERAVHSLLHRARQKARERLAEDEE